MCLVTWIESDADSGKNKLHWIWKPYVFIQQDELDESGAPPLKKICTGENAVLR